MGTHIHSHTHMHTHTHAHTHTHTHSHTHTHTQSGIQKILLLERLIKQCEGNENKGDGGNGEVEQILIYKRCERKKMLHEKRKRRERRRKKSRTEEGNDRNRKQEDKGIDRVKGTIHTQKSNAFLELPLPGIIFYIEQCIIKNM